MTDTNNSDMPEYLYATIDKEQSGDFIWCASYEQPEGFEPWTKYTRAPSPDLIALADALVDKLVLCIPHIDNAFAMNANRGEIYNGPQFGEELEAYRAARKGLNP